MEKDNKNSKRRTISLVVLLLSIIGIIYATYTLIAYARESELRKETYEEMRQQAIQSSDDASAESTESPKFEGWLAEYAQIPNRTIDFESLKQTNSDVYAWVYITDTSIDFPILFVDKNDYFYLHHDINKRPSEAGAIYTDGWNSQDFSDRVTLVYGHNMKDGTMFAPLHKYKDAKFFEENDRLFIFTQNFMLEYKIFAAYQTTDNHILANNDFTDDEVFANYLQSIYDVRDMNANFRKDIELGLEDRIITLVCSVHEDDNARFFVQGVLQKN